MKAVNRRLLWILAVGFCAGFAEQPKVRTLIGHSDRVLSVAFSPDGRILASGGYDRAVRFWDVQTGKLLRTSTGHTGIVKSVAFSPDGKTLASASNDVTVRLWDVPIRKLKRILKGHKWAVNSVAFSPDGAIIASASDDDTVMLWDVATGKVRQTFTHSSSLDVIRNKVNRIHD